MFRSRISGSDLFAEDLSTRAAVFNRGYATTFAKGYTGKKYFYSLTHNTNTFLQCSKWEILRNGTTVKNIGKILRNGKLVKNIGTLI